MMPLWSVQHPEGQRVEFSSSFAAVHISLSQAGHLCLYWGAGEQLFFAGLGHYCLQVHRSIRVHTNMVHLTFRFRYIISIYRNHV